jgi:hypothetical protein
LHIRAHRHGIIEQAQEAELADAAEDEVAVLVDAVQPGEGCGVVDVGAVNKRQKDVNVRHGGHERRLPW